MSGRWLVFSRFSPSLSCLVGKGSSSSMFVLADGGTVGGGLWRSVRPSRWSSVALASVEVQHAALKRRLVEHFNYFGVNGNHRSLARVVHATQRVWRKWLRRRSQRTRLTWERFNRLLERFSFPRPRVVVRIWGA